MKNYHRRSLLLRLSLASLPHQIGERHTASYLVRFFTSLYDLNGAPAGDRPGVAAYIYRLYRVYIIDLERPNASRSENCRRWLLVAVTRPECSHSKQDIEWSFSDVPVRLATACSRCYVSFNCVHRCVPLDRMVHDPMAYSATQSV